MIQYILTGWGKDIEDFPKEIDITADKSKVDEASKAAGVSDEPPTKSFTRYPMKSEDAVRILGCPDDGLEWELVLQRLYTFR